MPLAVSFTNLKTDFTALLDEKRDSLEVSDRPAFEQYSEDIEALRLILAPFNQYRNILLVANGGSVWSFMAFYNALADKASGKTVVPVTDMEPDRLNELKALFKVEDTLVLAISKSGETVGIIEVMLAFAEYKHLYVTNGDSPLGCIALSRQDTIIPHPSVGGRYSGLTSSAYVPAILADLPVEAIEEGARAGYEVFRQLDSQTNPALKLALALYDLEKNYQYREIFCPIYSNALTTYGMLITQLFHESFGKKGRGLTVLAVNAPESQHHTNQRFFGGRRDMVGLFMGVMSQKTDIKLSVPAKVQSLPLRGGKIGDLNGQSLAKSFASEYLGTYTDAKNQGIPLIEVGVSSIDGQSIGELLAFWHYATVFSSLLRDVNPYDQPQVENSKEISFRQRMG